MSLKYRLSLDIGTNSIGWVALKLDEYSSETGEVIDYERLFKDTELNENEKSSLKYSVSNIVTKDNFHYAGVLIFEEGRDSVKLTTLNSVRRDKRQIRKTFRARKWRKTQLQNIFCNHVLDKKEHDCIKGKSHNNNSAYMLREKALSSELTGLELYEVLSHMLKHRYFESNSLTNLMDEKTDVKQWKKDEKTLSLEIETSAKEHNHAKTLGAYYNYKLANQGNLKSDLVKPTRKFIKEELNLIIERQKKYFNIDDSLWEDMSDLILLQRPLQIQTASKCNYFTEEDCARSALPVVIHNRLLQYVANIKLINVDKKSEGGESELTSDEQKIILDMLNDDYTIKTNDIKKALNSSQNPSYKRLGWKESNLKLNMEKNGDKYNNVKVLGNPTFCLFNELLGNDYKNLTLKEQNTLILQMIDLRSKLKTTSSREINAKLKDVKSDLKSRFNVSDSFDDEFYNTLLSLDTSYSSYSLSFIEKQNVYLSEGMNHHDSMNQVLSDMGISQDIMKTSDDVYQQLPYYGKLLPHRVSQGTNDPLLKNGKKSPSHVRYGMVNNVTVHIVLNQIRKLVNTLISKLGNPTQIVIEVPRELNMGAEARQKKNLHTQDLSKEKQIIIANIKESLGNNHPACGWIEAVQRYKIYYMQNGMDPYTNQGIVISDIFDSSYQADHIIPTAEGGVDKIWNKVLTTPEVNRKKNNGLLWKTNPDQWDRVIQNLNDFISKNSTNKGNTDKDKNKSENKFKTIIKSAKSCKAYLENAKETWGKSSNTGFLPRQLTDTSYASKLAIEYLSYVVKKNEHGKAKQIWSIKGGTTADFRNFLHVRKDRKFLYNHALDALIIGLIDRSTMQALIKAKQQLYKQLNSKVSTHNMDTKGRKDYLNYLIKAFIPKSNILLSTEDYKDKIKEFEEIIKAVIPAHQNKDSRYWDSENVKGQLHKETLYSLWVEVSEHNYRKVKVAEYHLIENKLLNNSNVYLALKTDLTKLKYANIDLFIDNGFRAKTKKYVEEFYQDKHPQIDWDTFTTDTATKKQENEIREEGFKEFLLKENTKSVVLRNAKADDFKFIRIKKDDNDNWISADVVQTGNNDHMILFKDNTSKLVKSIDVKDFNTNQDNILMTLKPGDIIKLHTPREKLSKAKYEKYNKDKMAEYITEEQYHKILQVRDQTTLKPIATDLWIVKSLTYQNGINRILLWNVYLSKTGKFKDTIYPHIVKKSFNFINKTDPSQGIMLSTYAKYPINDSEFYSQYFLSAETGWNASMQNLFKIGFEKKSVNILGQLIKAQIK